MVTKCYRDETLIKYKHSQHFKVGSTLFQRCRLTLKERWSDVENETKSVVRFSILHNVNTRSVPDVETTLHDVDATSNQRFFSVVSTLVKVISRPSKSLN